MLKNKTLEETYNKCIAEGYILPQKDISVDRINAMLNIAEEEITAAEKLLIIKEQVWSTLYKMHYDIIHTLTEAITAADKIKILNHQCLFAYLCIKYPEMELDWGFFEKIRTKRNGILYYGSPAVRENWKKIELQAKIYIKTLKDFLKKKLLLLKNNLKS